jgi:hypothetical protein
LRLFIGTPIHERLVLSLPTRIISIAVVIAIINRVGSLSGKVETEMTERIRNRLK